MKLKKNIHLTERELSLIITAIEHEIYDSICCRGEIQHDLASELSALEDKIRLVYFNEVKKNV